MDPIVAYVLTWWFGSAELSSIAVVGLLLAARLLPLVILTPWLRVPGAGVLPTLCVASALWLVFLPHAVRGAVPSLPIGLALGLSVLREMALGSIFAVVANLPLSAVGWAGALIDRASGDRARADITDAPLATTYRWLGLTLFVTLGGAELVLKTIADGLLHTPVGGLLAWETTREVQFTFVSLCSSAITLGLVLAMPVLLGVLMLDVTQVIASRWLAQWPSSHLWLPLKHTAALALALLSLSLVASTLPDVYTASIAQARALMIGLTP